MASAPAVGAYCDRETEGANEVARGRSELSLANAETLGMPIVVVVGSWLRESVCWFHVGYELEKLLVSSRLACSYPSTYLDRRAFDWLAVDLGELNVNADRGACMSKLPPRLLSDLEERALAITPTPVSTRAWPREPALDPRRGISLRAWKLRGLRPRTTMGDVMDSVRTTLLLSARVP